MSGATSTQRIESATYRVQREAADRLQRVLLEYHPHIAMDACRIAYECQRRRAKEKRYAQSRS